MTEKHKSGESEDPRGGARVEGNVDPEDVVTSELSGLVVRAFLDEDSGAEYDTRITDVQLASHADADTEDTLEPGILLNDRFEIVELVHSGGMAHVYKAIDRRRHPEGSGQFHVAIKMLRESLADRDGIHIVLEREAAKVQSLSHPNIINVFDFDQYEGRFFLVMEWLEGESVLGLLRRTNEQRLSPAFAWAVIEGAAEAIRHVHLKNIVHADINPSNIFITTTHDIKLLDFGVARFATDPLDSPEHRVSWVTQTYASPEVLSGLAPVFQDDVFSLGCVAYRLLGGKHPFSGSPSIVAKNRGVSVEPIPGLPESDWQIVSRSLAYSRAERPDTVASFLRPRPPDAAAGIGLGESKPDAAILRWWLPVAAAVAVALAVSLWRLPDLRGTDVIPEDAQGATVDAIQEASPAAETTQTEAPSVEALLVAAKQAAAEERLVLPESDNAREWYREMLMIEPENPEALHGLRLISDAFVERADLALRSGDTRAAVSALTIASETDAGNPAIGIVAELLTAQGDAQLATARMAAAMGDIEQATAALAQAEQYAHIDPAMITAVREQLARLTREAAFVDSLAVADRHIAVGRLLEPAGDNAREALAGLSVDYGDDPRVLAAYQRLAERLLTRAAFATAAGSVADAESLLDAADSLGVLEAEVALARESLAKAAETRRTPAATASAVPEQATTDVSADGVDNPGTPTIDGETPVEADVMSAGAVASVEEPMTVASEVTPATQRETIAKRLEDLGLEHFVAPNYPRSARRRGLSGYVEVGFDVNPDGSTGAIEVLRGVPAGAFDESATDAVRQWRFAPRQDTYRGRISLRFEITD